MKKVLVILICLISILELAACVINEKFTVSFNTMGGTIVENAYVKKGNKVQKPTKPTKEGYVLIGWYTDDNFEKQWNFNVDVVENDICLYALWSNDETDIIKVTMADYIDNLIENTPSYIPAWNKESFKGRWNYIDGVFLNSIINLYYDLKDEDIIETNKYKDFFINYINYYIDDEGIFINPQTKEYSYNENELDSVCESKILFDAYELTNDSRYLKAIEHTFNCLNQMDIVDGSNNNFSHKASYLDQIWLDGMYMYGPFYARYANKNNNQQMFETLKGQYEFIRNKMFDEEKKLYYHGYSSTGIFWSDNVEGCSKSHWLRSSGWFIVSLVDVLEYFPEGENKEYLKGLLVEAIDGIMQYQDSESKMFYQVIDKGNISVNVPAYYLRSLGNSKYMVNGEYVDTTISNYLESSGSSMIAYALLKGSKKGYLDSSYLNKGKELFEGIYKHSFYDNALNDICITAGLGPNGRYYRDGTIEYYLAETVGSNDAKGVGPFIMAYLEYKNIK